MGTRKNGRARRTAEGTVSSSNNCNCDRKEVSCDRVSLRWQESKFAIGSKNVCDSKWGGCDRKFVSCNRKLLTCNEWLNVPNEQPFTYLSAAAGICRTGCVVEEWLFYSTSKLKMEIESGSDGHSYLVTRHYLYGNRGHHRFETFKLAQWTCQHYSSVVTDRSGHGNRFLFKRAREEDYRKITIIMRLP